MTADEISWITDDLIETIAAKGEDPDALTQEESIEILGSLASYCAERVATIRRERKPS